MPNFHRPLFFSSILPRCEGEGDHNPLIQLINDGVKARLPTSCIFIDNGTNYLSSDYYDFVHLNHNGFMKLSMTLLRSLTQARR